MKYRKNEDSSHGGNLSKPASFDKEKHEGKKPLTRVTSFKNSMDEFNPFKVIFLLNTLVNCNVIASWYCNFLEQLHFCSLIEISHSENRLFNLVISLCTDFYSIIIFELVESGHIIDWSCYADARPLI